MVGDIECWIMVSWTIGCEKQPKTGPKMTPKKVFSRAPGRGVLRFFAGVYSRPVHFLTIFAFFTENLQT